MNPSRVCAFLRRGSGRDPPSTSRALGYGTQLRSIRSEIPARKHNWTSTQSKPERGSRKRTQPLMHLPPAAELGGGAPITPSLFDPLPDLRQTQRRLLATHQTQTAHHPRRAQSPWGWGGEELPGVSPNFWKWGCEQPLSFRGAFPLP